MENGVYETFRGFANKIHGADNQFANSLNQGSYTNISAGPVQTLTNSGNPNPLDLKLAIKEQWLMNTLYEHQKSIDHSSVGSLRDSAIQNIDVIEALKTDAQSKTDDIYRLLTRSKELTQNIGDESEISSLMKRIDGHKKGRTIWLALFCIFCFSIFTWLYFFIRSPFSSNSTDLYPLYHHIISNILMASTLSVFAKVTFARFLFENSMIIAYRHKITSIQQFKRLTIDGVDKEERSLIRIELLKKLFESPSAPNETPDFTINPFIKAVEKAAEKSISTGIKE